jgi:hypothetical protein
MPHSHGLLYLSNYGDFGTFLGLRMRFFVLFNAQKKSLIDKKWFYRREGKTYAFGPNSVSSVSSVRDILFLSPAPQSRLRPQRTQRKNIIFRFAMVQDTGRPSIF